MLWLLLLWLLWCVAVLSLEWISRVLRMVPDELIALIPFHSCLRCSVRLFCIRSANVPI